jgi:hypothetical protein
LITICSRGIELSFEVSPCIYTALFAAFFISKISSALSFPTTLCGTLFP